MKNRNKTKKDEEKPILKRTKEVIEVLYKDKIIREYDKKNAPPMNRETMISQTVVRYYN